jgi:hypothetical protein
VPAQHDDDRPIILFCRRDRGDDAAKITRDENVGKRFEEAGEAAIAARR